jgi:hypothetical protein
VAWTTGEGGELSEDDEGLFDDVQSVLELLTHIVTTVDYLDSDSATADGSLSTHTRYSQT